MYVFHNLCAIAITLGHTIAVSKSTLSHSSTILDSSFICYWMKDQRTYHGNWIVCVFHNWYAIALTLGNTIPVSKSTLSHSCRILDSSFICYWTRDPRTYCGNWIVYVFHNWCAIALTLGNTIPVSKSTLSHSYRNLYCSFICYWTRDPRIYHGNWSVYVPPVQQSIKNSIQIWSDPDWRLHYWEVVSYRIMSNTLASGQSHKGTIIN